MKKGMVIIMNSQIFDHDNALNTKQLSAGTEVLFFNIGEVIYGIEIESINEIIGIEQITVVPKIPDYVKGVINIRGKVVPVISVRRRFGDEEIPYDDRTCIIVLEFDDGAQAGIIVDRVQEVVMIHSDVVCRTPEYKTVNANRYIKSIIEINGEIKLLLDCKKLILE